MKFDKIAHKISQIGHRMINCSNKCDGIFYNLEDGVPPRCLIFESDDRKGNKGAVVVGLNPGHAKPYERKYYKNKRCTYMNTVCCWKDEGIRELRYYRQLTHLVGSLGFLGPILWTELVKCEKKKDCKQIPLQTFRTCTKTYLSKELKYVPSDWPLVAVGREAYNALSYLFPNRIVIGVPHVTGSHGHFSKLLKDGRLCKGLRIRFTKLWDGKCGKTVWFNSKDVCWE